MKAKLESEADCGMVLCADDPELLDKLSWAAEKGQSRDWIHTFSHVNFIVCCHILRPFKPYSISLFYWYSDILCCRFESPVNPCGTCGSMSKVFIQINANYWMCDTRHHTVFSDYPP